MKNKSIVKADANAGSTDFSKFVRGGFKFLLEFGDACADPVPGFGYYCRTIEDARTAYRAHKNEGELFSLKEIDANGFESSATGWTA